MDIEYAKVKLGDVLCNFCPWRNNEDVGQCDGLWCEDAFGKFMEEHEDFFDYEDRRD